MVGVGDARRSAELIGISPDAQVVTGSPDLHSAAIGSGSVAAYQVAHVDGHLRPG